MVTNNEVSEFLKQQKVCSLTMLMNDSLPHAAAMHFSYSDEAFEFYFSTKRTSRKFQILLTRENTGASVVVGFSEEEWATLQLDGTINEVKDKVELEKISQIHYAMHPRAEQFKNNPETVFLKFVPNWWRLTKLKPEMKVISSED